MNIKHELVKKQKRRKQKTSVNIDLYPLASELYEELASNGAIQRLKDTPQLGIIKVKKDYNKSRFDYVILQLYFHQLIKAQLKNQLRYTYNNYLASTEFRNDFVYPDSQFKLSIMDVIQILVIVYNIGHYRNTFVASRAAVLYARENEQFLSCIRESSADSRIANAIQTMTENTNYQRFHLINSLLILDRCNQSKISIQIAKEILLSYINERTYTEESKLKYVFFLFRTVRNVAYIAYDLQIAQTPLTIDLCDSKAMVMLLKERLSIYNDNRQMGQLIDSIGKMLDDSVYNEESNAICYYTVTAEIKNRLKKIDWNNTDYYEECLLFEKSDFNANYALHRDYEQHGILKLTFAADQRLVAQALFLKLEHTNGIRVGYYDRSHGEQTVLVSMKKNCRAKRETALRVLKIAIQCLRNIRNIDSADFRFLLCVKFFLFYFTGNHSIVIKPTISQNVCVVCSKGRMKRVNALKRLMAQGIGTEDARHEATNLLNVLLADSINDVCISIPASILAYEPEHQDRSICEFDGMIIFPNRNNEQVVLLEAKNRKRKKSVGKKDLMKKLDALGIPYSADDIEVNGKDAIYRYSI